MDTLLYIFPLTIWMLAVYWLLRPLVIFPNASTIKTFLPLFYFVQIPWLDHCPVKICDSGRIASNFQQYFCFVFSFIQPNSIWISKCRRGVRKYREVWYSILHYFLVATSFIFIFIFSSVGQILLDLRDRKLREGWDDVTFRHFCH